MLALQAGHGTLVALARAAGVDRHTIGEALHGHTAPRRAVVAKLAAALGVPPEVLTRVFDRARAERS
jgi:transcriptional regulator with XRE-family HTH domain